MPAKRLELLHGELLLPAFLPDGTGGVVRSVDASDLRSAGIPGIVMNTYHLILKPGAKLIGALGGLHRFVNWNGVILTDSGGFQAFSLVRSNPEWGTIRKDGLIFKTNQGKKVILTPEKCIDAQFSFGSDIMMCLDYCTHPDDPYDMQKLAVDYTIRWAERSKLEYDRMVEAKYGHKGRKPLLFAIIQGGNDKELRHQCAEALTSMGFDGYGFGGWPLQDNGVLLTDILSYTAQLIPPGLPRYAMGIGKPENIIACARMGYNLFDCVIPTREARHGKLYIFNTSNLDLESRDFYECLYIKDDKYIRDDGPISESCDCYCCRNFSRAYLRHLFISKDCLAYRLATIHNLRFYTRLMSIIRDRYPV